MKPDLKPPSLLRSPLLWLGLMVLAFMGWAWRDSATRWIGVQYGSVALNSQASGVTIAYEKHSRSPWYFGAYAPSTLGIGDFPGYSKLIKPRFAHPEIASRWSGAELDEFEATGKVNGRPPDPMLLYLWAIGMPHSASVVFIPHWCLMLAVLLPWLGLLAWLARKRKKWRVIGDEPRMNTDSHG